MPLNLQTGAALVGDQTLQYRVAMAFYFVARNVFTEDAQNTRGHEQRLNFARSIILQDYKQFLQYTAMVVTDPAIVSATPANNAAVTDVQILAAVSGMWNTLAQVPPERPAP